MKPEQILLGENTTEELERILGTASHIGDHGERIAYLSSRLLGVPYAESTLIGDDKTPEIFVVNLEGVDCLTFVEYIEAMRISSSFHEFIVNLKRVRYKSGNVHFYSRNHFFSDWRQFNGDLIEDVTEEIGLKRVMRVLKNLNKKENGTLFLQGIEPVMRDIRYLPADAIDSDVIKNLRTGDYIGIYSRLQGLDVSHTGIMIRQDDSAYIRHASSHPERRRVIDQDFKDYVSNTPGIVVYRPKKQ